MDLHLELKSVGEGTKAGILKHWVYDDQATYQIVNDYLQKIRFSVEDINNTLDELKYDNKTITFIVTAVDWIVESTRWISKAVNKEVINEFCFTKYEEYNKAYAYFKAIRSFLVAHPLKTEKHKKFSLDGTYICMDVRTIDTPLIKLTKDKDEYFKHIDYDGMHPGSSGNVDFYLFCYSEEFYENECGMYIGICVEDIIGTARLAIDIIYELDSYLSKQKKRNFVR